MTKVIVVTGASDGVGRAAARKLVADGHSIVAVGRSPEKTRSIGEELRQPYHVCDFADLAQVRTLAGKLAELPRIDVLVHNAGLMAHARTITADGHELAMQVNHLAPFVLTAQLIDLLRESRAAVISTSSMAHRMGRLDPQDLTMAQCWTPWRSYGASKLANILFSRELHRRHGDAIRTASFHPGLVGSSFAESGGGVLRALYRPPLNRLWTIPPERGADTLVWLAETSGWPSGGYYVKRKLRQTSAAADDADLARALWDASSAAVAG